MDLYEVRRWLEEAIKAAGGEITDAGMTADESLADVSFKLNGEDFWLDLKPWAKEAA